jgi:phosphoribosyl-ATP pyrophosphohydrolase/phosphoribosyl-AMP cyclohydrolase
MRDRSAPLTEADIGSLAWEKMDGLLPALVQDPRTGCVLMLGYMDQDALAGTLHTGLATFYSRSKQRLWQKGESSGNRLKVRGVFADCDDDALLVLADPEGPTCHLGTQSCFVGELESSNWLPELSSIIAERAASGDASSYTRQLLDDGPERIAKKIGEEGIEVALAGVSRDIDGCVEEVADLVYHISVLMEARGFGWGDVMALLKERHANASKERTASS